MRTTIRLDDRLLAQAKRYASQTQRTLTAVIEDALREVLARRQAVRRDRRPFRLPVVKGGRLLPGIDLDNNAALLDRLDGFNAPR